MAKKILCAFIAVTLLATAAQAVELGAGKWPQQFVPQETASVPIVMDVGYWIRIRDQDQLQIKLTQKSIHEYSGCTQIQVETNVNISLSCSISPTGAVPGDWSCSITPSDIDAPGGTATVCATVKNADLTRTPGGGRNVHVATVSVKVVPRA